MRNGRAPTATAPAEGCIRAGPKSGSRPCWTISRFSPSYWPRRTSASFTRSGRVAAPRRGRPAGRRGSRSVAERAGQVPTQSSIVVAASGTNGMTSTAPIRGCSPPCASMSISWIATPTSRSRASATASCSPASVKTERLWLASLVRSRRKTPGPAVIASARRVDDASSRGLRRRRAGTDSISTRRC